MDVANLIKKATTLSKGDSACDVCPELLSAIKNACKHRDDVVKDAFYYLSTDLARRNGAVRIRCLTIMDCLLHRSKVFRQLVCSDIRTIVSLMGLLKGSDSAVSSGSHAVGYASELEAKGKELIEVWDHLYGDRHPQLRAVARYLREHLGLEMPNILENARQHAVRAEQHRTHSRNMTLLLCDKILQSEWGFYMPEWRKSLTRLEELFGILFPRLGDAPSGTGFTGARLEGAHEDDPVDWIDEDEDDGAAGEYPFPGEEYGAEEGESSAGVPYTLTIRLATTARELETEDNAVLLQHIREIAKHLAKSAVPRIRHWQAVLSAALNQRLDMQSPQAVVEEAADNAVAAGASSGTMRPTSSSTVARSEPVSSSTSSGGHGARKRNAAEAALDAPDTGPSSTPERALESRLRELDDLLGAIRALLTGKVKTLLSGEQL